MIKHVISFCEPSNESLHNELPHWGHILRAWGVEKWTLIDEHDNVKGFWWNEGKFSIAKSLGDVAPVYPVALDYSRENNYSTFDSNYLPESLIIGRDKDGMSGFTDEEKLFLDKHIKLNTKEPLFAIDALSAALAWL